MMVLPDGVKRALELLEDGGYEAFVVGGAVRDHVMGRQGTPDWDLATDATPKEVERVFAHYRRILTGVKHGTVTVMMEGLPLEITTYRVDGDYLDRRRPEGVRFTASLEEDLARRDFTMNAMAYHPKTGVVDCHGGMEDIRKGRIRCVGDPDRRFGEDALRMLRALRFASVYAMGVEEETAAALLRNRDLLTAVSPQRVQGELTRLLCGQGAACVLREYREVLAVCIPQLALMFSFDQKNPHHDRDIWEHTVAVVEALPPEPVLRWAGLLHDVGKPETFTLDGEGVGHFYGHARRGGELAEEILTALAFDRRSREQIMTLVRCHGTPIPPERRAVRRLLVKLGEETLRQLLLLHRADAVGQAVCCLSRIPAYEKAEAVLEEILAEEDCFSLRDLAVNGHDLLALGVTGKEVGNALAACLTAVTEESLENRREVLLSFVEETWGR